MSPSPFLLYVSADWACPGSYCITPFFSQSTLLLLPSIIIITHLPGTAQFTVLLHIYSFSQPAGIYWAYTRCKPVLDILKDAEQV